MNSKKKNTIKYLKRIKNDEENNINNEQNNIDN